MTPLAEHPLVKALPRESILHYYLQARSIIEPPVSYDLLCGLAALAAALKRSAWVDQVRWRVYPATSVMLVGPSGIGKNTAIAGGKEAMETLGVKVFGGLTSEAIVEQALRCGTPASGVMVAEELADLIGKKDYQQGIIQTITDLLDTKEVKDITLKGTGNRQIRQPTFSFICGSTAEWLHNALPKDSMSGGFYGRFVVSAETSPKRRVSLVKRLPKGEILAAEQALADFNTAALAVKDGMAAAGEVELTQEAGDMYEAWYERRESTFSALAADYAHRSRDHALRAALVCALSCMRAQITAADMHFALTLVAHISQKIDVVVAACSPERGLADKILRTLPQTEQALFREFSRGFAPRLIKDALALLRDSGQARWDQGSRMVEKVEGEEE